MRTLRKSDLRKLLQPSPEVCLSLFLAPQGDGPPQDSVLQQAQRELSDFGARPPLREEMIAKLDHQVEWKALPKAVSQAIYCSANLFVHLAIPYPVAARVTAMHRFDLSPLQPLIEPGSCFRLRWLRDAASSRDFCISNDVVLPDPDGELADEDSVMPVLLAGNETQCRAYRNGYRCDRLLPAKLNVSQETSVEDAGRRARTLVQWQAEQLRASAEDEYRRLWHTARASNDLPLILRAAGQGRVKVIFAARECISQVHTLCDALFTTFLNGGSVFCMPRDKVPGTAAAAAVFHY